MVNKSSFDDVIINITKIGGMKNRKPILFELYLIGTYFNEKEEHMPNYIPVITRGYSRKVNLDEVLYLEQRQRKLAIVTTEDTYICYERIESLEKLLDERFYHSLKKLVVNMDKIMIAENQKITFVDGTVITMGRESYIRTKQRFSAYLKNLL